MDRLAEISENADFNEWRIIDASDLIEDYYSIYLDKDKGKQFLEIRLHRNVDEEMSGDNTWYKTTKKAYEHICTITDLMDDDSVPERTPMMINAPDEHDPFVEAMTERYHLTGDATAANAIEDIKERKGKGPVILKLKKTKT